MGQPRRTPYSFDDALRILRQAVDGAPFLMVDEVREILPPGAVYSLSLLYQFADALRQAEQARDMRSLLALAGILDGFDNEPHGSIALEKALSEAEAFGASAGLPVRKLWQAIVTEAGRISDESTLTDYIASMEKDPSEIPEIFDKMQRISESWHRAASAAAQKSQQRYTEVLGAYDAAAAQAALSQAQPSLYLALHQPSQSLYHALVGALARAAHTLTKSEEALFSTHAMTLSAAWEAANQLRDNIDADVIEGIISAHPSLFSDLPSSAPRPELPDWHFHANALEGAEIGLTELRDAYPKNHQVWGFFNTVLHNTLLFREAFNALFCRRTLDGQTPASIAWNELDPYPHRGQSRSGGGGRMV